MRHATAITRFVGSIFSKPPTSHIKCEDSVLHNSKKYRYCQDTDVDSRITIVPLVDRGTINSYMSSDVASRVEMYRLR